MLRCSMRFEDNDADFGKRSQRPLDAPSDILPWKTAETGTERRYGYRTEIETTNLRNERLEARVDVLPIASGPASDAWWGS